MTTVKICSSGGLIVRKDAMNLKKVKIEKVLAALETYPVMDENEDLVSIGPIYPDAIDELIRRVEKLGLAYFEDFFEFKLDVPEWIRLHTSFRKVEIDS